MRLGTTTLSVTQPGRRRAAGIALPGGGGGLVSSLVTLNRQSLYDAGDTNSYPGSGIYWNDLDGNNGGNGVVSGAQFTSAGASSYFTFDGVNDSHNLWTNLLNFGADFTLSHWVYSTGGGTLMSNRFDHSSFQLRANKNNGKVQVLKNSIQLMGNFQTSGGTDYVLPQNVWVNVTCQRSGNVYTLYINGASIGSFTSTVGFFAGSKTIGANYNNTDHWNGRIAVTLAYQRALTAAEILQNYNFHKSRYGHP